MQLTLNGALMVNSDPLALALHADVEVSARVLSWKTVSIKDRYATNCQEMNQKPIVCVSFLLEEGSCENNFKLRDQYLTTLEFQPVCRTLKLESPLNLDLANNFLTDDAVKELISAINTKHLRYLDLSKNCLTSTCLIDLKSKLPALETLNLNFNAMGDAILPHLYFATLQRLHLSNCGLQNLDELPLEGITYLNISFNNVSSSMSKLRRKITDLEELDVSFVHNVDWNSFFTGSLINLKCLWLSGCDLQDAHCYQLLEVCQHLEQLDLSFNPNLTNHSTEKLLKSNMKRLLLEGCPKLLNKIEEINSETLKFPEHIEITVEESEKESQINWIKKMWRQKHQEKGNIKVTELLVTATLTTERFEA